MPKSPLAPSRLAQLHAVPPAVDGPLLESRQVLPRMRVRARGTDPELSRDHLADFAYGTVIDRYIVIRKLGHGGMGAVYHVEQAMLGRQYALKVLHAGVFHRDLSSVERFLQEARAAARIRHPNIVDVFDFSHLDEGRPYFVMELLAGQPLARVLQRGALEPARAVQVARKLAEALAVAHDSGVVHADVSSNNVFVDFRAEQVVVKLLDFGFAELRNTAAAPAPVPEFVFGTPSYIAPEVLRGARADERSDQYSFGATLYEMLDGRPPFVDEDAREVCRQHLHEAVAPLANDEIPRELSGLVMRCLHKDPASRFENMHAMVAELERITRLVEQRRWRRWLSR